MVSETIVSKRSLDRLALLAAGLGSGLLSLLITAILTAAYLGSPWFMVRVAASLVFGPEVIPLSDHAGIQVIVMGILVYLGLSLVYATLIVLVIHRWGLVVGFVGGGLLGLAIYFISLYALTMAFPWIYPLRSWILMAGYVAHGALTGTIYELLDEDETDVF